MPDIESLWIEERRTDDWAQVFSGAHWKWRPALQLLEMDPDRGATRKRIGRLLECANLQALYELEALLVEKAEFVHERITNPEGIREGADQCGICGGKRPPHPECQPWPRRKETGRAQGARCSPCIWSQRHNKNRSSWQHWQAWQMETSRDVQHTDFLQVSSFLSIAYVPVWSNPHPEGHGPPWAVATRLHVPSCRETCSICGSGRCYQCPWCCLHYDNDLSIIHLSLQQPVCTPAWFRAWFCIADEAYPFTSAFSVLFNARVGAGA